MAPHLPDTMALKLITSPDGEPITVAEAKQHLRVDGADEDTYIATLIVAARQRAELETGRWLLPQVWELGLKGFPVEIRLHGAPLIELASISYVDQAGVLQTMAGDEYQLDDYSEPPRIVPAWGTRWPVVRCQPNAVLVRAQFGYADAAAVPAAIKQWMLLTIAGMYENREDVAAGAQFSALPFADRLLDPYRLWSM
jgi:uncharacterized phiE125 gp8 family phage protein